MSELEVQLKKEIGDLNTVIDPVLNNPTEDNLNALQTARESIGGGGIKRPNG